MQENSLIIILDKFRAKLKVLQNISMSPIKPGLYEVILSERLRRLLAEAGPDKASLVNLEDAEAPVLLANH